MAGLSSLFSTPPVSTTQQPGAPSPADAALRLFIMQLLLSGLSSSTGKPQTLGDYMSKGPPASFDPSAVASAAPGLMSALQKPGAFTKGPTTTTQTGGGSSTFEDISGAAMLPLLLLSAIGGPSNILTGGGGVPGGINTVGGWLQALKNKIPGLGGDTTPVSATGIGDTSSTSGTQPASYDPNLGMNVPVDLAPLMSSLINPQGGSLDLVNSGLGPFSGGFG